MAGLVACAALGCVHIPDEIRREFRETEPGEASNFRKGSHGRAPGRDLVGQMPTQAAPQLAQAEANPLDAGSADSGAVAAPAALEGGVAPGLAPTSAGGAP